MSTFYNRTRTAPSIPRKLLREGKPYLIPLYYLLRTSALAREGIDHSGSYRFADHIYAGKPAGRFGIGWALDFLLLRLPSAQSFRDRYRFAKEELWRAIRDHLPEDGRLDILAVPCGLARELFEIAAELKETDPGRLAQVGFYGLDLDEALVAEVRARSRALGVEMTFWVGDALSAEAYPKAFDVVLSLGLTEFLDDTQTLSFYRLVRSRLKPGGRLINNGLGRNAFADYLLRNLGDLHTNYRTEPRLRALAAEAGFGEVRTYANDHGLQTMLITTR